MPEGNTGATFEGERERGREVLQQREREGERERARRSSMRT